MAQLLKHGGGFVKEPELRGMTLTSWLGSRRTADLRTGGSREKVRRGGHSSISCPLSGSDDTHCPRGWPETSPGRWRAACLRGGWPPEGAAARGVWEAWASAGRRGHRNLGGDVNTIMSHDRGRRPETELERRHAAANPTSNSFSGRSPPVLSAFPSPLIEFRAAYFKRSQTWMDIAVKISNSPVSSRRLRSLLLTQ